MLGLKQAAVAWQPNLVKQLDQGKQIRIKNIGRLRR